MPDEDGKVGPFLDLMRDINYGDSTYLCGRCVQQIAGLFGYIDEGQYADLERALRAKDEEIHELKADFDSKDRRLRVIEAGSRTLKRVRSSG